MKWRCGFEFWYKWGGKCRRWPWRGYGRQQNVFDNSNAFNDSNIFDNANMVIPPPAPVQQARWKNSSRYQEIEIDGWRGKIDLKAYESIY